MKLDADLVTEGVSGDYDVCNGPNDATWAPFQKTKVYDLPDVVFEQTNAANLNTRMGLFAKLNHAWMIIDSAFYMWDYTVPNPPLQGYEDSPYSLKFARICVPRRGVFAPTVTHVLVLASVAEITLIAIGYAADANGIKTLTMYKTGMTTGVQGIGVDAIASSVESGRIFFSGNNELYEIKYQQEERWFWPRCRKINHTRFGVQGVLAIVPRPWTTHAADKVVQIVVDDSRRLLYTLSKQSDIQVWHMDAPNSLVPVITKTRRSTLDDISHMSVSPLLLKDLEFTSIHPISAYEGYRLHLMATTSSGCRLYLSATRGSSYITSSGAPHSMQVQHIRYPPTSDSRGYRMNEQGLDTTSEILCHTRIAARFPPGFFFCFVKKEELGTHDAFFMSAPDTGRIATEAREPRYYETATWLDSLQHTEDVGLITQPFAAARQPLGFGNELAVQFDEPVPEIAVLTNTGVHIIRRRRLVDMFAASIRGIVDEGLDNEIKKFIRQYGRGETTATALAVACGQGSDSGDGRLKMSTPETIEAARKAFVDHGGRPSVDQNLIAESSGQILDNVRPSSRHEGMALYISRLLRSIWKAAVVREGIDQNGAIAVSATISSDKLKSIQDELTKLRSFLHQNKSFIEGLAGPDSLQRVATQNEEYALQGEHQALNSLVRLNESIIEGISFVQVLFEERIDQIWATLDEQVRRYLRDLTYERLFSTTPGKDLAKTLVKAIVHRNIANGSNVDTVADALRRRCGSFCSPDDVVIFKAQEQLQKASEVEGSSDHGRMLLNESLRLFEQVSASLTMQNLRTAVQEFTQLQFYAGAIKLVLLVASQLDRGHTAEAWVSVGKPPDDPRESKYVNRIQCYDLVHNVLTAVDDFTTSQPDTFDGRPSIAALKRNEAYAVVNEAKDELFQNDLYDWYLIQGWTDRLLGVESRYIVPYLDSIASQSADKADLLWKYHVQHEDFYNAAVVQLNLAKGSLEIPLARRVHYLIRAKANASTTNGVYGRQQRQYLLHEISELLDVANIQDELLQRLRGEPRIEAERKQGVVQALDGQIQDLTSVSTPPYCFYVSSLTTHSSTTATPTKPATTTSAFSSTKQPTTATKATSPPPGRTSSAQSTKESSTIPTPTPNPSQQSAPTSAPWQVVSPAANTSSRPTSSFPCSSATPSTTKTAAAYPRPGSSIYAATSASRTRA